MQSNNKQAIGTARQGGLARRLAVTFSCLIGSIVACVIVINTFTQIALVNDRLQARKDHLRQLASELSLRFLLEGRPAELEILFDDIAAQVDVARIFLIDESGMMFVDTLETDSIGFLQDVNDPLAEAALHEGMLIETTVGDQQHIAEPITLGGIHYGVLRIDMLSEFAQHEIHKVLTRNALAGVIFI